VGINHVKKAGLAVPIIERKGQVFSQYGVLATAVFHLEIFPFDEKVKGAAVFLFQPKDIDSVSKDSVR
jgi:hypothetical protein